MSGPGLRFKWGRDRPGPARTAALQEAARSQNIKHSASIRRVNVFLIIPDGSTPPHPRSQRPSYTRTRCPGAKARGWGAGKTKAPGAQGLEPPAKYGALSNPDGRVSVSWDRTGTDVATILTITWRELGGPPIATPVQSGYGSSLIRDLIPHELGGIVDLRFPSDGAYCKIEIPLKQK